jgi:two-component system, OmpR family, sensor kinase
MHWRSLYWRIALGVVAFLAAMLAVQAMLFVWAVSQSGRNLPGQSPARLGMTVALDLANVLERDPHADLAAYIKEQYAQYAHPFFVMMAEDNRVITSGSQSFPEPLLAMARARLQRGEVFGRGERLMRPPFDSRPFDGAQGRPFDSTQGAQGRPFDGAQGAQGRLGRPPGSPPPDRFDRFDRFERAGDRFERDAAGVRFVRPSPIIVDGRLAGVVVVPPQAPFGFLLGRYGPMLALIAGGVLVLGAVLTSFMIFGPARRRLRQLEQAAFRFGAGDLTARAPDRGGDEIAAVANAFNTMADDLATRANALAASDRIRRQLLADVSHELTTPVTAMRGYIETLTMADVKLDEETRARYLGIIGDETHRLERLIGDLLDLARLEGGGGAFHTEDLPVAGLFERVVARHEYACSEAGIAITTSVDPGAETVHGDRDRLEQALQNLAANAIRYAPRGTAVRLTATRDSGSMVLAVSDEGPGIAPDQLPHVFDRFYKADPARTFASSGGSGLGLSIVKAIVERLGGSISVTSEPGRTVFEMRLPRPAAKGQ